jgi:glycosyltransferase involved in cell wall biosynthesis
MKILHSVLSEEFYGSERYCLELATGQVRAGHEVGVLILGGHGCARRFSSVAEATGNGKLHLFEIPRWQPAFMHRSTARNVLARFKPDLVHTHLAPAARTVGAAAQQLGIACVATLHITYDPQSHAGYDGLICIASWQRESLPPTYAGEVALVSNWLPRAISRALEEPPDEVAAIRAMLNADETTVVFGSAGRLLPDKGMDRLIRCFRAAFPFGNEPVRIIVAGDGPMRYDIEELCGRDARVSMAGMQAHIATIYRAIDVYVSAARFEPFGLAIVEAMAAGCPLVLTRTQGPSEFVTDPRVRWADADDEVALVDHMRAAAAAGRERFSYDLSRFCPKRAMQEIDGFYDRVMARARRQSAKA